MLYAHALSTQSCTIKLSDDSARRIIRFDIEQAVAQRHSRGIIDRKDPATDDLWA